MDNTRVAFIGGFGRSGSTLLERVLGQLNDVVVVGELKFVWERGLLKNELCGCGLPFRDCPFWTDVFLEAFGGIDKIDLQSILQLQRLTDRFRYVPLILFPSLSPSYHAQLNRYTKLLLKLYQSIRNVSGATVIVDSSKDPSHGYILASTPSLDLRILHLVRDSRAVGFSWSRKRVRPEVVGRTEYMPRYSAVSSSIQWLLYNYAMDILRGRESMKHLLLKYETFVKQPEAELQRILSFLDLASRDDFGFLEGSTVVLKPNHTVAGNPIRFASGTIHISLDNEWKRKLGKKDKALITALTWPLLRRYGYRLIPGQSGRP